MMKDLSNLVKNGAIRKIDFKTIKMFSSGKIHVSKEFIEQYQIGTVNGIDFAFITADTLDNPLATKVEGQGIKKLVMVITPIKDSKPLPCLFASKKQLQSNRFVEIDGKIQKLVTPKDSIRGVQTDIKLTDTTLLKYFPNAESGHIVVLNELQLQPIDIFTTTKNERIVTRENPVAILEIDFINIINKKIK